MAWAGGQKREAMRKKGGLWVDHPPVLQASYISAIADTFAMTKNKVDWCSDTAFKSLGFVREGPASYTRGEATMHSRLTSSVKRSSGQQKAFDSNFPACSTPPSITF